MIGAPVVTSHLRVIQASGPGRGALLLLILLRLTSAVSESGLLMRTRFHASD